MKYKLHLTSSVEIPNNTKYVLLYSKKSTNETKLYPLSEIIIQNNKLLKAEVIGSGIRSFLNNRIVVLTPVKENI